jgi:hypothetical protein
MTPQQQMIYDAFNSEVYVSDRMDVQHTPLYDTVRINAGGGAAPMIVNAINTTFFTNVGPASGKTLAQTNMTQASRLPAPEAFAIFGFRLKWNEDILDTDLIQLLGNSGVVADVPTGVAPAGGFCLEFTLGQKIYQRAPLWYYASGGGISGFTTQTADQAYSNGLPAREAMHKLAIPIVIENQMTFEAHLTGTPFTCAANAVFGGRGITLTLLLDGLYARGVQ